jgi:hypothetical protein
MELSGYHLVCLWVLMLVPAIHWRWKQVKEGKRQTKLESFMVEPERRMIPEPNRIITGFAALVIISIGYLFAAIALSLALTVSLFSAFPYCGAAALCGLAGSYLVRTMERTTNPDATPGVEPRTEE